MPGRLERCGRHSRDGWVFHRTMQIGRPPTELWSLVLAMAPVVAALAVLAVLGRLDPLIAVGLGLLMVAGVTTHFLTGQRGGSVAALDVRTNEGVPHDILERIPDPVILLNAARVIIGVNRAARDLFGIGMPGRDLAMSLRHPAVLAAVETVFSGVTELSEEITLPVPVPRTFTFTIGRLSVGDDPAAPAAVLVLHDETRAQRAEQSRADFVANASHELRSPLSALIGFIETLRGPARNDEEARDRFLDIMRGEALRMARLIEDLLSLSRVEINEHVPPRTALDVRTVLAATSDALTGRAAAKNMTIVIETPERVPSVTGDKDQLTQVFHNLVDNAVKYGRTGSDITVNVRPVERLPGTSRPGLAISVTDRGEGISAVHLPRITERFYRIDESRSRKLGGTGLGLAIVKHIINRHRGQLKIVSEEGIGSTVTVLLPVIADAEVTSPEPRGSQRDVMQP
ncbi:MAG: PAS domain-containing protein [Rhodospirillales bacterium]|nr:MAG: PAS domain-containing protein [Rhodospirillales bacterium]